MSYFLIACTGIALILYLLAVLYLWPLREERFPRFLLAALLTPAVQYVLLFLLYAEIAVSEGGWRCDNIPAGLQYSCTFPQLLENLLFPLFLANVMTVGGCFALTAALLFLTLSGYNRWRLLRCGGDRREEVEQGFLPPTREPQL